MTQLFQESERLSKFGDVTVSIGNTNGTLVPFGLPSKAAGVRKFENSKPRCLLCFQSPQSTVKRIFGKQRGCAETKVNKSLWGPP